MLNVKGDANCVYRVVSILLGKEEESHTFFRQQLIKELKVHKKSYIMLYEKNKYFDAIYESLILCVSGSTPEEK